MSRLLVTAATAAALSVPALPALAETELSFYLGAQEAAHSRVRGDDPSAGGAGSFDFLAAWQGKSFQAPPYYGVRATWWQNEQLGFGIELNHAKVYSSDATRADNGLDTLEFTDGLNIITANVMYRWPNTSSFTPYVGAGLGVSIPHVEFQAAGSSDKTFNYQFGGPAAALIAGVSYDLTDTWAVFGEYKATYSRNDVELEGGGNLQTNIVTNAVNFGVTYKF